MKQKVQIDVLDVSLFDRETNHDENESMGEPSPSEPVEKDKTGNKWWKSKYMMLSASFLLLSVTLGLTLFLMNLEGTKPKNGVVKKMPPSFHRIESRLTALPDFIIPFKDRGGKERLFICSLTLETGPGNKPLSNEASFELRRSLYHSLQKNHFNNPSSIPNKHTLKSELYLSMNQRLGNNVIANVYFTKFVVL